MKYLILSDIHGNLEALQSVLREVRSIKIDKYIVLGDLVGYGADPNEVVDCVGKLSPIAAIRGNHDRVAAGLSDDHSFNYTARNAARWTRRKLSRKNRDYIASLPQGPVEVDGLFDIAHGSPWDEDYYILQWWQAQAVFMQSDRQVTFIGHTHVPIIWSLGDGKLEGEAIPDKYYEYSLEESKRYLINPGSVGQPRDGNPRASLAIFDTDEMKMQFFRIEYDIKSVQAKIRQAGLDGYLADRLAVGR